MSAPVWVKKKRNKSSQPPASPPAPTLTEISLPERSLANSCCTCVVSRSTSSPESWLGTYRTDTLPTAALGMTENLCGGRGEWAGGPRAELKVLLLLLLAGGGAGAGPAEATTARLPRCTWWARIGSAGGSAPPPPPSPRARPPPTGWAGTTAR